MEILNKTIDYNDLYEELNKNYPDKKLHDFTMGRTAINNVPRDSAIFKGEEQVVSSNPNVVTFKRVKFLDFDIGDNVDISYNRFVAMPRIKSLWQNTLKKLRRGNNVR